LPDSAARGLGRAAFLRFELGELVSGTNTGRRKGENAPGLRRPLDRDAGEVGGEGALQAPEVAQHLHAQPELGTVAEVGRVDIAILASLERDPPGAGGSIAWRPTRSFERMPAEPGKSGGRSAVAACGASRRTGRRA
jgi:hypothetical protein